MPKRAQRYAGLLGAVVCLAACGLEPLGDGGTGTATAEATTTGNLVRPPATTNVPDTTGATVTGGTTTDGGTTGGTTAASTTGGTATGASSTGTTTGGTVTGGNACTPDGWDNYAKAKFSSNCSGCHGISYNTLQQVVNDKAAVEDRIKSRNMPKGITLDTDTYNRLIKWMDCGLPQ